MVDGYFVTPQQASQVEMVPGIYRRTMSMTDEVMLCEFYLESGAHIVEHSHTNDQVGYIVSGQVEVTIGSQTRILNPGDSYAIPGGVVHSVRVLENSLVVDVFSPPRHDYITEAR